VLVKPHSGPSHGRPRRPYHPRAYKSPGEGPSASDVYQMVTYCERLGLRDATLVYPAFQETREYRVGERTVRAVGLRFPGFDIDEAVLALRPAPPVSDRGEGLQVAEASPASIQDS
jgi:hypothetical protein